MTSKYATQTTDIQNNVSDMKNCKQVKDEFMSLFLKQTHNTLSQI
jgi:hypothetical protein